MNVTRRAARGWLATLAVAGVAVTVACGAGAGKSTVRVAPTPNSEAGKTGPQVLADATHALASAPEVHFVGTETEPGTKRTVTGDLRATREGGTGTLRIGGATVQLIAIGKRTYLKGDLSALFGPLLAPDYAKVAGRWVYDDESGQPSNPLAGLTDGLSGLDKGVTVEPTVTTGTLNGQPVIIVRESDGSRLYVAATGAPLPLKVDGIGTATTGLGSMREAAFSYDDARVQVRAPAGAIPMPQPSFDPKAIASLLPSVFPSGLPSGLPSNFPSELASELQSGFSQNFTFGSPTQIQTPTPTP